MSRKDKFLRRCIACSEFKNKESFIKITRDSESGELFINTKNDVYGRSVYICRNKECINTVIKKKKIERNLKKNMNTDVNEFLKTVLEE